MRSHVLAYNCDVIDGSLTKQQQSNAVDVISLH